MASSRLAGKFNLISLLMMAMDERFQVCLISLRIESLPMHRVGEKQRAQARGRERDPEWPAHWRRAHINHLKLAAVA